MDPRIAVLKPLSAAIAIGSGGPFGAEGPIIMTGGAFGSLIAQWMKLTDAERTTLLVAGAAAGMSATFAAPLAAAWFRSPWRVQLPLCCACTGWDRDPSL